MLSLHTISTSHLLPVPKELKNRGVLSSYVLREFNIVESLSEIISVILKKNFNAKKSEIEYLVVRYYCKGINPLCCGVSGRNTDFQGLKNNWKL